MTEPIDDILPRKMTPNLQQILEQYSGGIDEVVNFGTHILNWEVKEAKGGDENIPISMSLRHILEMTDAISILVKQSSIDPCKLILRGILESFFGLEYIILDNTVNRALGFLVWHFHKDHKAYKKLKPGESSNKVLNAKLAKDKSTSDGFKIGEIPGLDAAIENTEELLKLPIYAEAEDEYQKLIKNGVKNPKWYQLFGGPSNIESLATSINRQALYEVFYRAWSGPTHGTDIINSKLMSSEAGRADIVQIRFFKDAQAITQLTHTLAIMTFQLMVRHRIKIHEQDYLQWYAEIQPFYMGLLKGNHIVITV